MTFFTTGNEINFKDNHYPSESFESDSQASKNNAAAGYSSGAKGKFVSFLNENQTTETRNVNLLNYLLQTKERQYCEYENINVFCGTYNVNGQMPSTSLKPWLSATPTPPDIYAVGFQELDLSQQAFLFDSTPREHDWAHSVKQALHSGATYVELKRIRLVGMFLLIFVRKDLPKFVDPKTLDCVTVGTGLLNRMGNKGGVAVRFHLHDTKLCFVCSHLAAGSDELERRNQDFQEICKVNFFQYEAADKRVDLFAHDFVFWLGDLNYRLQQDPDFGDNVDIHMVKRACEARDFDCLLKYDQLRQMQAKNKAFNEFKEGSVTFMPTYKYDPGTDRWDSSEKSRVPAWTDRILWLGDDVKQLAYTSVPSLKISDHKPVYSLFSLQVKRVNPEKYKKVYEAALRETDRLENEYLPQVAIDRFEFRFDEVKFLEAQTQTLTVTNTGQVPVKYSFRPKTPNDTEFCKPWLMVTPDTFFIKQGEKCVINLTVLVDKLSVFVLNTGKEKLEEILVLHLDRGKDFFITVSGSFVRTCFGQDLDNLLKLEYPIRSPPVAQLIDLTDSAAVPVKSSVAIDIPKELYRLVDHIYRFGLDQPDLFYEASGQSEFSAIRDALDTGYPEVLPGSIYSVVQAFLRFLDSLPNSVIPAQFTERCLRSCKDTLACKRIVTELPESNRKLFVYLIKFLKEVISHGGKNGTNPQSLARLSAPLLLRLIDSRSSPTSNSAKERIRLDEGERFVSTCLVIENFDD